MPVDFHLTGTYGWASDNSTMLVTGRVKNTVQHNDGQEGNDHGQFPVGIYSQRVRSAITGEGTTPPFRPFFYQQTGKGQRVAIKTAKNRT